MRGTILGLLIIRTIVCWGLLGSPYFGKLPNIHAARGRSGRQSSGGGDEKVLDGCCKGLRFRVSGLGSPLGYLIFSLMALMGDPI